MRLKVKHETVYTYREPVRSAVQLLRLTPRSTESQFVRKWRVTVDADARLDRGEDAYGNITHLAFIDGPYVKLSILVEGEVDTADAHGLVKGGVERQSERLFMRETPLTLASPQIRELARDSISSEGGDLLAGLHRINTSLHKTMAFRVGSTTVATTAGDAFAARSGVCQDFAHVFIAAARVAGVPCRYVSGYYLLTDRTEQDAGHAWAEAHLPALGWIAFDPAHGHCATERHVRVAVGGDSNDASPIRGARTGGLAEELSVSVSVRQGREVVDMAPLMSQTQQQ